MVTEASKPKVALTRNELNRARNSVKARFMPREGSILRMPNGVAYRVVFSNVGQLRFTALFDCVFDMASFEARGMADALPEEMTTA